MVYIHDPNSQATEDMAGESQQQNRCSETTADPPPRTAVPHSSSQETRSVRRIDMSVHDNSAGLHTYRLDLSINRSASECPSIVEIGRSRGFSGKIPVRDVTRLRSFFDLAGSSACSTSYGHGREFGGKSGVLALQVPASSLPPPLNASVVAESVHMASSAAFFPAVHSTDSRLLDAIIPAATNKVDSSASSSQLREGDGADGNRSANVEEDLSRPQSASSRRNNGDIFRRLSEVLQGDEDADLILPQEERDDMMSQWLQALDLHVAGACRAEERLPPMLRWNVACAGVDGGLIARLNQHFGAKELGMLAQCLCTPLVSIRVGKVEQQGQLLCPSALRGYLSLVMLPSSEMRLSFTGDNGVVDKIALLKPGSDFSPFLEMLPPDTSGRTFVIKLLNHNHYFWQSEKSKDAGDKLLSKIKELLRQRPTLAQLTGIHESRLDSFVNQLRSALLTTSSAPSSGESTFSPSSCSNTTNATTSNALTCSSSTSLGSPSKLSQRFCSNRSSTARAANSQLPAYGRIHFGGQGSLSPRASGFKDGSSKASTGVKLLVSANEKHKRRTDIPRSSSLVNLASCSINDNLLCNDKRSDMVNSSLNTQRALSLTDATIVTHNAGLFTSLPPYTCTRDCTVPNPKQLFPFPLVSSTCSTPQNLLPSLFGGLTSTSNLSHPVGESQVCLSSPGVLTPYYCPCPLRSSALQYTITPPFFPSSSDTCSLSTSSSLYSIVPASTLLSQATVSLDCVSISPIPLPVPSLVYLQSPLQASSLPLLFSDPIVHIPVIDFESGSPSFLVNAPQAMSSSGTTPVLPSLLSSILSGIEANVGRQELPEFNNQDQVPSFCWNNLENHGYDVDFFLAAARSRSLCHSKSDARFMGAVKKLDAVADNTEVKEDKSLIGPSICETKAVGPPSYDNLVHFEAMPKYNASLKGIVPTVLTSRSVSCVLNFSQEMFKNSTAWVSGSRGLYGGACDPGSLASPVGINSLVKLHGREFNRHWPSKQESIRSENSAEIIPAQSSPNSEGHGLMEEDAAEDSFCD